MSTEESGLEAYMRALLQSGMEASTVLMLGHTYARLEAERAGEHTIGQLSYAASQLAAASARLELDRKPNLERKKG